ncbi:MAG TPA: DNA polymerase III subunit gamma/tau [Anaerolineae bacterium]|nr:DNA polymerase III subunit gamma/tau [Anaerolineae bacterium]HQI86537.1 DNA polymerase III subunit gamma/tau [Anaerolineae bacterium]
MAQALYRKWRPQTFDDVVGQEHIVRTLRNALQTGRLHHAYLLAGPRGTGKTTTARLIAKAVNCLSPLPERPCDHCEICRAITDGRLMDLSEIDAASNTGVDNIRELLEKVGFRPTQARYKVYVVDEVHMLSTAAFNALLKTLEEPPEHVIFVLATTEVHKIPETILSRCQRFEFRRIPLTGLVGQLKTIADAEGIAVEPEALDLIARAATGSMRDAISLFDQMAAGGAVTADYVRLMLGAERREVVQSLLQAWLDGDLNRGLHVINEAVDSGADPRQLARQTADFFRGLLLMRVGAGDSWTDPTAEERPRLQAMAKQAQPERLVQAVQLFSEVASERRSGWQPQLPLELAFVEAALKPEPSSAASAAPLIPAAPRSTPEPQPARQSPEPQPATPRPVRTPVSRPAAPPAAPSQPEKSPERARTTAETDAPSITSTPAASVTSAIVATAKERWRDVIAQIRPVNLGAFLRDAQPMGVDGEGFLVLGFQHTLHRNNVDKESNRQVVETFLSQMFGQKTLVRCVMEKEWQPGVAPAAAKVSAPSPSRVKTAPTPIPPPPEPPDPLTDELVRRAMEELGAEVRIG